MAAIGIEKAAAWRRSAEKAASAPWRRQNVAVPAAYGRIGGDGGGGAQHG